MPAEDRKYIVNKWKLIKSTGSFAVGWFAGYFFIKIKYVDEIDREHRQKCNDTQC